MAPVGLGFAESYPNNVDSRATCVQPRVDNRAVQVSDLTTSGGVPVARRTSWAARAGSRRSGAPGRAGSRFATASNTRVEARLPPKRRPWPEVQVGSSPSRSVWGPRRPSPRPRRPEGRSRPDRRRGGRGRGAHSHRRRRAGGRRDPADDHGRVAGGHGPALDTDRGFAADALRGDGGDQASVARQRDRAGVSVARSRPESDGQPAHAPTASRASGTDRATVGRPAVEDRAVRPSVPARRCRRRRRRPRGRSRQKLAALPRSWQVELPPFGAATLGRGRDRSRRQPRRRPPSSDDSSGETRGGACRWRSRSRRGWSMPRSAGAAFFSAARALGPAERGVLVGADRAGARRDRRGRSISRRRPNRPWGTPSRSTWKVRSAPACSGSISRRAAAVALAAGPARALGGRAPRACRSRRGWRSRRRSLPAAELARLAAGDALVFDGIDFARVCGRRRLGRAPDDWRARRRRCGSIRTARLVLTGDFQLTAAARRAEGRPRQGGQGEIDGRDRTNGDGDSGAGGRADRDRRRAGAAHASG